MVCFQLIGNMNLFIKAIQNNYQHYNVKLGYGDGTSRVFTLFVVGIGLHSNLLSVFIATLLILKTKLDIGIYLKALIIVPILLFVFVLVNNDKFWRKISKRVNTNNSKKANNLYWLYQILSVITFMILLSKYGSYVRLG